MLCCCGRILSIYIIEKGFCICVLYFKSLNCRRVLFIMVFQFNKYISHIDKIIEKDHKICKNNIVKMYTVMLRIKVDGKIYETSSISSNSDSKSSTGFQRNFVLFSSISKCSLFMSILANKAKKLLISP